MARHPLLVFPEPARAEKARRYGRGRAPRIPDAQRQAGRLAPQFDRIQRAIMQDSTAGLTPEKALVLETVGPIENFVKAVRKVEGLEWLGEFELDSIAPDYGFEDEKDPEKQLKGQLFLIMADQHGFQILQGLFRSWQQNPEVPFPRGLAPLKHAFVHLHTIRP